MTQHLVLSLIAAPLLAAGAPLRLAIGALPRDTARNLTRGLRSRLIRGLAHPLSGTLLFCTTLLVVHVPAVYDAALTHSGVHLLEHATLFWSAVALWVPVIGTEALPRRTGAIGRVASVIAAMTSMAIIGAALSTTTTVVYPAYAAHERAAVALADQQTAGGLMWVGGMVVVLPLLLLGSWRALVDEERRARARELSAVTHGA